MLNLNKFLAELLLDSTEENLSAFALGIFGRIRPGWEIILFDNKKDILIDRPDEVDRHPLIVNQEQAALVMFLSSHGSVTINHEFFDGLDAKALVQPLIDRRFVCIRDNIIELVKTCSVLFSPDGNAYVI